jgi:predicted acyl esterase
MVQVQSSWFPLVDRNPQKFTDIYHCKPEDFQKSTIRIHHEADHASRIRAGVLP